jgi:hypothetical protein
MSGGDQLELDLEAVKAVVNALAPLDQSTRARVMTVVATLLGEPLPIASIAAESSIKSPNDRATGTPVDATMATKTRVVDVRTLRDEKQPRSANEMAAVAAYYLAELAPERDRAQTVTSADMEKYFKQAGHPLPRVIAQLLPHASAAGYFDQSERGRYKLNPVGYNLVTHGLPAGGGGSSRSQARPRRQTGVGSGGRLARKTARNPQRSPRKRSR